MFLDAVGESPSSLRRGLDRGAWAKYSINEEFAGMQVDVFLLDERFEREVIPCSNRRKYCEQVLATSDNIAWCRDFLHEGPLGKGSCCDKDELIFFGWCKKETSKSRSLH